MNTTSLDPRSLDDTFPRYSAFDPQVPVWCLTPKLRGCIHRFFDSSPVSPSGRYLAVTRFRDETRLPGPTETAEVVLVDLNSGESRVVAESCGFGTQLGAQAQWGPTDGDLYFNDLSVSEGQWHPHGVRVNPETGGRVELSGPVYMISPNGRHAAGPCLLRTEMTQYGYGALAPAARIPQNVGAVDDDGLYLTDTEGGECKLLISYREIADRLGEPLQEHIRDNRDLYGFHVKWNSTGDRLLFVVRARERRGRLMTRLQVVVVGVDASELHLALPSRIWARGGHHPDWCPDGEHIIMNLKIDGPTLRFVRYKYDGTGLETLAGDIPGSGHPSMHPDGRHIVTDEYLHGDLACGDGSVPLRIVDIIDGTARQIVRIRTRPDWDTPDHLFRADPHPAWDRSHRFIAFNGCPDGTRQVFLADLSEAGIGA